MNMSRKLEKTESFRTASTKASASITSPIEVPCDDSYSLPLIWEKVSDKIVKHINGRFDKLKQTLQAVQSSQAEQLEKVESIEQVSEQDGHPTMNDCDACAVTAGLTKKLDSKLISG